MSGRRLLDAAAMLRATRGVTSKYAAIQKHQLDIYSKTSSLTKVVRYQTGQSTLKEGAGSAPKDYAPGKGTSVPSQASTNGGKKQLEKTPGMEQDHPYTKSEANAKVQPLPDSELGVKQEKAKSYPLPDGSIPPAKPDITVPRHDQDTLSETTMIGLGQDSLTGKNTGINQLFCHRETSTPDSEAKAKKTIPDRTREIQRGSEIQIPSVSAEPPTARLQYEATPQDSVAGRHAISPEQDVFHIRSSKATRVLSSLPRVRLPKVTGDAQGSDSHVPDDRINQDVFYSASSANQQQWIPEVQAVPEQEQPSDDMYSEIFHSPRVAKLLKRERKQDSAANHLNLRAVHDTPVEQARLSQEKDQESFNTRPTGQDPSKTVNHHNVTKEPSPSKKADAEDAHKLAQAMAQDIASASSVKPEVSIEIHLPREALADKLTVILQMSVDMSSDNAKAPYEMHESRVPSSRFGRLWQYGGLATSMAFGAVGESFRRVTGGGDGASGSLMLSAGNMERLVAKLSKMRGAALKLGQMMSFQGLNLINHHKNHWC